jgi:hypothetical protein
MLFLIPTPYAKSYYLYFIIKYTPTQPVLQKSAFYCIKLHDGLVSENRLAIKF